MKKQILLVAGLVAFSTAKAQTFVSDSVSMNTGYPNESYYSLENGEVLNVSNQTWDLAFDLGQFGAGVRVNQHAGVEVYVHGTNTDWSTLDTTGMAWNKLNNSDKYWGTGALNTAAGSSQIDLGWGEYNMTTHHINASRSFVLKFADGSYKKLLIESLVSGTYTFKTANLDGSSEISNTLTKTDYTNKNFAYYSIASNTILDREPTNNTWDFVFTKYATELFPGTFYTVTGALTNKGVYVRQADNTAPMDAVYDDFTTDSVINVIGYDWKAFGGGGYTIKDSLSYFVEDKGGNLWQLKFERFDGSSTGKIVFGKRKISGASLVEQSDISSLGIAPNPASNNATIAFNSLVNETAISIVGMNGKVVYQNTLNGTGMKTLNVDVTSFRQGMYIVQLTTKNGVSTAKLIVQ